ncbi:MAG: hypothetical protein J4G04_08485 [Nitrosopumilaceae archaeon]|nr:hypothetical protein [Nitrosopumilaceae archaeon]
MLRRHTNKDVDDDKVLEGAKKVMYALIIGALIAWLGTIMFNADTEAAYNDVREIGGVVYLCQEGTDVCKERPADGSGGAGESLASRITGATTDAKAILTSTHELITIGLTVAALGSIGVLRIRHGAIYPPP